jgi:hypothetical protein
MLGPRTQQLLPTRLTPRLEVRSVARVKVRPASITWLGDPVELPGFVLGEVPGSFDKFNMIHWGAMIVLRRKLARHDPRSLWPSPSLQCCHSGLRRHIASATFPTPRQTSLLISRTPRRTEAFPYSAVHVGAPSAPWHQYHTRNGFWSCPRYPGEGCAR